MAATRSSRSAPRWLSIALLVFVALSNASVAMATDIGICVPLCANSFAQDDPTLVAVVGGGAVVAWHDARNGDSDIYLQRILPSGVTAWTMDGVALRMPPGEQYSPVLAPDASGGAIVAFLDNSYGGVVAQRVSAAGVPLWGASGVPVGKVGSTPLPACIVSDGAGGAIIEWSNGGDVYAQRLDATGALAWGPTGVPISVGAPFNRFARGVCADGSGGAVCVWTGPQSGLSRMFGQHIRHDGTVTWLLNGVSGSSGSSSQIDPQVGCVSDKHGGAFVVWNQATTIKAQHFDSLGTAVWTASGYTVSPGSTDAAVASDGGDGAFLSWSQYGGNGSAFIQRVHADGTIYWPAQVFANGNNQSHVFIVPDGAGGVLASWHQPGANALDIRTQKIGSLGQLPWGSDGGTVCSNPDDQLFAEIAFDGTAAFLAWKEQPVGNGNIAGARVDLDFPVPTTVALADVEATADHVTLSYYSASQGLTAAAISRRAESTAWTEIASGNFDGTGHLNYEDRGVTPGGRYAYRLEARATDGPVLSSETWVDVPTGVSFGLDGSLPNPGPRLTISFSLPDAAPAKLDVFDVDGRRIGSREVGPMGPGTHRVDFSEGGIIRPGVYLIQLVQGGRRASLRRVLVQ